MEQGRRHLKAYFSVFDWVLLGIVAVAIALGSWAILSAKQNEAEKIEIRYRILLEGVPFDLAESWKTVSKGSEVTNGRGTAQLGRVEAVEVTPGRKPFVRDGEIVMLESPDTVDVTVTVIGYGSMEKKDGMRILSHRIAAGCNGDFRVGACYAPAATIIYAEWQRSEAG